VLVVGDAAGQVKPTSGGGIYTSITCARIAGEVSARAARSGDTSERALSEYERRWRALLEQELRFGFQAHLLLARLSDAVLARLFRAIDDPRVSALFGEHGDIDYTSRALQVLLTRPTLWGRLMRALPFDIKTLVELLRASPDY
jgi:flavin-dependent dehydrogenase